MEYVICCLDRGGYVVNWKKVLFAVAAILELILIAFAVYGCEELYFDMELSGKSMDYETRNLADYGNYVWNYDEEFPAAFINSFFPPEIGEDFQNVTYVYHARRLDEFGFEAYLEFTFADEERFEEYYQQISSGREVRPFAFDEAFEEIVVSFEDKPFDFLYIQGEVISKTGETDYYIGYAGIGKILFNRAEKRIIYVALAVNDGGGTDTGLLDCFFSRFDINPKEYEEYIALQKGKKV